MMNDDTTTPENLEAQPATEAEFTESFDGKAKEFIDAAEGLEADSPEKAVDAWRKAAQAAPQGVLPRLRLGALLKRLEKWNAAADALNDGLRKIPEGFAAKRVEVLEELLFLYSEKMKLDPKVLETLKAIVALRPRSLRHIDLLIEQLERMKRLPDLVAALAAKADAVDGHDEKVAIQLDIARTFIEKFSNQAEAIKAYEKVLALEPANPEAIGQLKGMYEKRRDWEKLVAVATAEVEATQDPEERRIRMVELARMATEKLKRPAVSADLWSKVLDLDPENVEALEQLEKVHEREKNWEALGAVCDRQLALAQDTAQRAAIAQKLGLLYTEKVNVPDKAIVAWKQLLECDPANRRAQDALKKLYLTAKAWDELEQFYAAQDKWDEFIRVLERQVESEEAETKIQLLFKTAILWLEKMGKADRAVKAYEQVLEVDGTHLAAAEALIPLYRDAANFRRLVAVLEIQLGHTTDPVLRLERVRALAGIYEENLRDQGTALTRYLEAFQAAFEEEWIRTEIERLSEATGDWGRLVSAYESAAGRFGDPAGALPLLAVVARVYEEKLGDLDAALETNQKILVTDDVNLSAIAALQRLYQASEDWEKLLGVYQKLVDLATEESERRGIYFQIAQLYVGQLANPAKAIEAYSAILDLSGEDAEALWALNRLYDAQKMWTELAATINRQLAQVDPGDVGQIAELKFRLGTVAETSLEDPRTAIDCYRDILDLDAAHEGARAALEQHLGDDFKLEVSRILEPIYQTLADYEQLVRIYEIQLAGTEEPSGKVELLLRIGDLHASKLGDFEGAFNDYSRCVRIEPANETARNELFRIAEVESGWAKLVALFESVVEGDLDAELQRQLFVDIAEMYDTHLDGWDKAVGFFRKALAIEPDDRKTLEALEKLYTRREKWADLLEIHRRKVDLTSDTTEREALQFQIAYLQEEMLGQLAEAVTTYREIVSDDDTNLRAWKSLDRLLYQQSNWHELADNLTRQLELTLDDPAEQLELRLRLAELRETRLEQVAAAVDTYREVLELDGMNEAGTAALERLLVHEEHQQTIAGILEPIYRSRNDWQNLIHVLEIMVKHSLDPAAKIEILLQIGELYEVAGDDSKNAFGTYGRALVEDPTNVETQQRLERLARELESWEDLVGLYTGRVQGVTDEELAVMLHTKIAEILESQVGDLERAAKAYENVLGVSPARMEAADALERIFVQLDDSARLVQVVLRKAGIVEATEEKKALLFRAAQIHEDILESQEAAIGVYNQVLDLDENDRLALDNLEKLYIRLERWESLKDVYTKKAELADSDEDRKKMLYVLGQVYDTELKDLDKAIDTYQHILEIDTEDYEAIRALDRLYFAAARWYDLLSILEREVELAGGSPEVVGLRHRIGQLWENQLGDLVRAVDSYREALSLDPYHEPTVTALDAIVHGPKEPVAAAHVLEPIYEAAMEWERLIDLCEVMVVHAEDAFAKVELLHRIAMLYETQLDRAKDAFLAQGRAFREDQTNELTLEQLERLAGDTQSWADLAKLYEEQLEKTLDGDQQTRLLLRVARVYEEELQALDQAITKFQRVLDTDPENQVAILALDRLFQACQKWTELTEILRREITMADGDDQMVELQFRLGQTFEVSLKDMVNAIEVYRDIVTNKPDHEPTVRALELLFAEEVKQQEIATILEPLYQNYEQWDKLAGILEVQLGFVEAPSDRQAAIQRIAELYEHSLSEPLQAFRWWGRGFAEDPSGATPGEEVERLAGATGAWEELVALYAEVVNAAAKDPALQQTVLLRIARVQEFELVDLARAEEAHLRVLQLDARNPAALESLDRIYTQSGQFEELAKILHRRIGIAEGGDDIIVLQFRLAAVYQDTLADPGAAVKAFLAVLEQDPRSAEALDGLERIYFRQAQWKELFGVYEKMVDIAGGDSETADCYAHMAKIASDALGDPARALELWGRVLDLRGEDPVALAALADLYEAAEKWADLSEVLQRQVVIADQPEVQIAIYERLGRLYAERLGRERDAIDSYLNILSIDGASLPALWALAALYRQSQAWDELVDTLQRLIEIGLTQLEEAELKALYAQLGELQGDILMRPQEAIEAWRKVLTLDPADFKAMAALETLFTQENQWEDCIEVLERKARALTTLEDQIDVLMQAASIWLDKLYNASSAAEVYERILQAQPGNMTASTAVEAIYNDLGSWEKLGDLLMTRVEHLTAEEEQVTTLQSVARLYEEKLSNPEHAFEVLKVAFSLAYTNEVTAKEFERLASTTGKWNELLAEYSNVVQTVPDLSVKCDLWVKIGRWYGEKLQRPDYAIASLQQALGLNNRHKPALSALADFYRMQSAWPELVAVMSRHSELEEEPEPLTKLHLGIAELYEDKLGNPNQAIQSFQAALKADGSSMDALAALERLYRLYQQWEPLIDVLKRKAAVLEDMDEVVSLKMQVGELYEDRVDDAYKAIESYKEITKVDPQHLEALRHLEKLYEKTGQMEEFLSVIEAELDIIGENDERISKYQQMAATWEEHFDKIERACECYEKILLIDERNANAFRNLERLYRQDRKWSELVETLSRHVNAVYDNQTRVDLYLQIGEVYERELKDTEHAIGAYSDILSLENDHTGALSALSRLYEVVEDWDRALDALQRLVEFVFDQRERLEIFHRLGHIYDEKLGDIEAAEERYVQALEIDRAYVPSMTALTKIYQNRGDWLKAAKMMVQAEASTSNILEKTKLLFQSGVIYLDRLEDKETAKSLLARVLEIDPEHVEAAEPLSQLFFMEERYSELEPIVDMLVRKVQGKDSKSMCQLFYTAAFTAEKLGNEEKSLRLYKQAYDADSTHFPTLKGMANLLYRQEDWEKAFKIYQTILVHHRDDQSNEEITDIFFRLGNIKLKQGDRKKALNMYEKALEVNPGHADTLLAVIDLESQQSNWEAVIHAKRALVDHADSVDEKFKQLDQIGEIYQEKLKNGQKALAAYAEALELKPSDHSVLQKSLELFYETKQWKKAVDILLKFVEVESNPKIRSRYYYSAAVICRDEIKSHDEAVEYFNLALDDNYSDHLKAFESLDKILTSKKDWKSLERNYRRMVKRIKPGENDGLTIMLLHALGEIYRSRLRDFNAAIETFELAVQLEPGNLQRHEILAELYELAGPERIGKAVEHHQILITAAPDKFESYHKLYRIYMDTRQYDKAWCVASALAFTKRAEPEERQLYEQYKAKGFVRAKQRMSDELWQRFVYAKEENRLLGLLFGLIQPSIAAMKSLPFKNYNLKRKDRRDVATDQLLFSKVFNYACQVLNLPEMPELYLMQAGTGIKLGIANEKNQLVPFCVVGQDLLQGRPEKELAYVIARELSFMRPEHLILKSGVQSVGEIKAWLFGAMKLVNPGVSIPPDQVQVVDQAAQALAKFTPPQKLEQVAAVVAKLVQAGESADLGKWLVATDYSANHAGFILANDAEAAASVIARDPVPVGGIPAKEKIKELVLYSISEEYFEVRNQLGLSIGG